MTTRWTYDEVAALDKKDPLGERRGRFSLPPGVIYLDGNSLGPLVSDVPARVRAMLEEEWGTDLVAGWTNRGWMEAPGRIGDRIAPLIGAMPGEVIVADTTSVALAKMLGTAFAARPERRVVLTSTDNFPSDLYAAEGAARLARGEVRVVDRRDLEEALTDEVAVCCLTHVDFKTGEVHDLPAITARTHEVGALSLWDLCHSAGAVPVGLEENGVDLAVGCTYKYLNGGPGSPSFLYVRRELQNELDNPLPGWLGHERPFDFAARYEPARGIRRFLTSSPPIVALSSLETALEVFSGITIADVREKSLRLGQLFIDRVDELAPSALSVASPREDDRRGSQVSLRHDQAAEVVAAAAAKGVVGDFRTPDVCRFGLPPLYLTYEDVFRAAETICEVAASFS